LLLGKFLVDFRYRLLAFRGADAEPPRRIRACGVSPVPLLPQESNTLHSTQLLLQLSKWLFSKMLFSYT